MDNGKIGVVVAILVIAYALVGNKIPDMLSNIHLGGGGSVAVAGEVFPDKPTDPTISASAQNVIGLLKSVSPEDKLKLARLWREQGKIVLLDSNILKTTADVRNGNDIAGRLLFEQTLKGKYPGLAKSLSDEFKRLLGDDAKPLDGTSRNTVAAAFNGLSWAARQ